MIKNLSNITLIGFDGRDDIGTNRLDDVLLWCMQWFDFGDVIRIASVYPETQNFKHNKITRISIPFIENPKEAVTFYNLFHAKHLANLIQTDYCMTVHTDGFIINPNLWNDEFLNYDYIGAPWCAPWFPNCGNCSMCGVVGNGGFSIRSKKYLQHCKSIDSYDGKEPEDWFFTMINKNNTIESGIKIADSATALKFSVEAFCHEYKTITNSFGFHGKWHVPVAMEFTNNLKKI